MKTLSSSAAGWEAYTCSRSPEMRERLLLQYMPLVRRIAGRMLGTLPRNVRLDDLISAGVVGLLSCLDSFDPSLGIRFETFAMNRIRGAMVDSLRELDWVPRSIRQKARLLEKNIEALLQELGRTPQDGEVADRLGVPLDEYYDMLDDVNVTTLLSLDDTFHNARGDSSSIADMAMDRESPSSQERLEEQELRELLVHRLKNLPEQEKLVVALYYYEELTLKEIGDILNLTESRVSQIHSKAILNLRSGVHVSMSN
jgi:RNA polymerase sigma factor for flagellar operon FliA